MITQGKYRFTTDGSTYEVLPVKRKGKTVWQARRLGTGKDGSTDEQPYDIDPQTWQRLALNMGLLEKI